MVPYVVFFVRPHQGGNDVSVLSGLLYFWVCLYVKNPVQLPVVYIPVQIQCDFSRGTTL